MQMVMAGRHYECTTWSFLINECQIKKFFSGCILNFEKGSFHYGLDVDEQTLGHPYFSIYRALVGHDIIIKPRLLFMETSEKFVNAIPLGSDEDLVARIPQATARVCEISGIFEDSRQSLQCLCQAYIVTGRSNSEQLL
ncbi:hypothetical protein TNCV_4436571 [Trichonephila clavipes]|nr:hypothetical protein TNCV_4436571 [Trichonephila clavipes]